MASESLITVFRADDAEVIRIGVKALRYQLAMYPFLAWFVMNNMLTQSIGYGFRSSIIAMCRQGIFYIPCALILPTLLEETGLALIQPIADIFTVVLTTYISFGVIKELKKN